MAADFDEAIGHLRREVPFEGLVDHHMARYRSLAAIAGRHLAPGARVLDFGAGFCDKSVLLRRLGYACDAVDDLGNPVHRRPGVEDAIVAFAQRNGVDFSKALSPRSGPYDMAILMDVLPHIHDTPRPLMETIAGRLKSGGYLVVTVANLVNIRKRLAVLNGHSNLAAFDGYWNSPSPWRGAHREYVRGDLKALSSHLGLEVVSLRGEHLMANRLPKGAGVLFTALTAPFTGLRDTWVLVARKPLATKGDRDGEK